MDFLIANHYVAMTAREPFGVALVGRRHDGIISVGAALEDPYTIKPPLESLRDLLKHHHINAAQVSAWVEDGEGWIEMAELAKRITGIDFQGIYQPIVAARQALASLLATQGPTTSKFQIDRSGPGAELLAQRIDARASGGVTDATALCCLRIEEDYPGGNPPRRRETKVITERPADQFWGPFGTRF
jgi:hypothetical protein